jgi:hypothetical protein
MKKKTIRHCRSHFLKALIGYAQASISAAKLHIKKGLANSKPFLL